MQLYYWLSAKSSAYFSKKWTQFLSSLERFSRNAAKAVVDLDRTRPCKCVLHSFFDRKRRPGVKKKMLTFGFAEMKLVLVNYLVTYKTFKISYKTRHWQLCFVYFYWCYCIFVIIYKIVIKLNIMKKKPQQQHKNICIFYWISIKCHLQRKINYLITDALLQVSICPQNVPFRMRYPRVNQTVPKGQWLLAIDKLSIPSLEPFEVELVDWMPNRNRKKPNWEQYRIIT